MAGFEPMTFELPHQIWAKHLANYSTAWAYPGESGPPPKKLEPQQEHGLKYFGGGPDPPGYAHAPQRVLNCLWSEFQEFLKYFWNHLPLCLTSSISNHKSRCYGWKGSMSLAINKLKLCPFETEYGSTPLALAQILGNVVDLITENYS